MPKIEKSIFVSMGNPYRLEYEEVLEKVMEMMQENGFRPRVINKTDYPIGRPLEHISSVLAECCGAIIVAFERSYFPNGKEKRGSRSESDFLERRYTTPWNHIEAALAYQQDLPILVFAEEGVHQEGLIEEGHRWYVERFDLQDEPVISKLARSRLQEWFRSVHERPEKLASLSKIENLSLQDLITNVGVKTLWSVGVAIVLAGSAIFSAGVAVGKYFPTH